MGPAGHGKSALGRNARSPPPAGEKAVVFAFDESLRDASRRARGRSASTCRPHVKAGWIVVRQIDPAELLARPVHVPGSQRRRGGRRAHGHHRQPQRLPRGDARGAVSALQLHELLSYLGRRAARAILVVAQHGLLGASMHEPDRRQLPGRLRAPAPLLRGERVGAQGDLRAEEAHRQHESAIRELRFSAEGITAGEPLTKFRGVLTGVPSTRAPRSALVRGAHGGHV